VVGAPVDRPNREKRRRWLLIGEETREGSRGCSHWRQQHRAVWQGAASGDGTLVQRAAGNMGGREADEWAPREKNLFKTSS
jgi:hypothetical protein